MKPSMLVEPLMCAGLTRRAPRVKTKGKERAKKMEKESRHLRLHTVEPWWKALVLRNHLTTRTMRRNRHRKRKRQRHRHQKIQTPLKSGLRLQDAQYVCRRRFAAISWTRGRLDVQAPPHRRSRLHR